MQKRNLSFAQLFNLSFGFFGVQIAYALQSANISRIFSSLGADPHSLSFFWVLPPLMGMLVQPLVGKYSDRTWNKLGRRKPYLLIGAIIAVAVMLTLPNANSVVTLLGLFGNAVIWFGVFSLIFLDTSINIAMQPFKMMVGDMVNEEQKGKAYAIQSFLCNAGSLVGFVLPYVLGLFAVNNTPSAVGEIADTVKFSFYIGAIILILCVLYTFFAVKEMNPEEYAKFHGLENKKKDEPTPGLIKLLFKAPKTFWTISIVQFFCWAAFLYMWTYTPGAISKTVFNAPDAEVMSTYMDGENSIAANYIYFEGDENYPAQFLVEKHVLMDSVLGKKLLTTPGTKLIYGEMADKAPVMDANGVVLRNAKGEDSIRLQINKAEELIVPENAVLTTAWDIDVVSEEYNNAGNWVGILFAIQALGSIVWAALIPRFKRRKVCYSLSLALGGIGFISTLFVTSANFGPAAQYVLFGSFLLVGCAWAAMLALPFTIFTNSLTDHIGSYLGLFNCTICLPQIAAALLGGILLSNICAGAQIGMLVIAGVLLLCGAAAVFIIKEGKE